MYPEPDSAYKGGIVFNRKFLQGMKIFNHAQTCYMSLYRIHYTTHGLHMNSMGKDWITNIWAMKIKRFIPSYLMQTHHFSALEKGCLDLNN